MEAADNEHEIQGERLELLAVVRGLEALDQPSRVTLVTPSLYVDRGLKYGLEDWRSNGWQWERFGEMVPVKNRDLWQRVDRALQFHQVECCSWRFDGTHGAVNPSDVSSPTVAATAPCPSTRQQRRSLRERLTQTWLVCRCAAARRAEVVKLWMTQLGARLLPVPRLD